MWGAVTEARPGAHQRQRCLAKSSTLNGDCSNMCPSHHFTLTPCDAMCIAKNVSSVIEPSTPWSKPKSISTAFWHTTKEPCIPINGSSNIRYCKANLPKSSPTRIVSASEHLSTAREEALREGRWWWW